MRLRSLAFLLVPSVPLAAQRPISLTPARGVYAFVLEHAVGRTKAKNVIVELETLPFTPLPPGNGLLWHKELPPESLTSSLARLAAAIRAVDPAEFAPDVQILAKEVAIRRVADAFGNSPVVAVSPVAFNADLTEALVYYEIHCARMCGGGAELWLRRQGKSWRLRQEIVHWQN